MADEDSFLGFVLPAVRGSGLVLAGSCSIAGHSSTGRLTLASDFWLDPCY